MGFVVGVLLLELHGYTLSAPQELAFYELGAFPTEASFVSSVEAAHAAGLRHHRSVW